MDFCLGRSFGKHPIYNSLIEAVALGNTRLNDISQKSLWDDTVKTSTYLRNLIELGIIGGFSGEAGTKERANAKQRHLQLTQITFFRFWYAFAFTNYSDLEAGDVDGVYAYAIEPISYGYAAFTLRTFPVNLFRRLKRKMRCRSVMPKWEDGRVKQPCGMLTCRAGRGLRKQRSILLPYLAA